MPRTSTQTTLAGGARAAIERAQSAKGFDPAPSRVGSKSKKGPKYEGNDLQAARSGELSKKMEPVFSRDSRLDPGVEEVDVVIEGKDADLINEKEEYVANARDRVDRLGANRVPAGAAFKDPETGEVLKGGRRLPDGVKVQATKAGAVRFVRNGSIPIKGGTVQSPFKGSGGKFSDPEPPKRIRETRVVDEEAFRDGVRRRIKGYGASLFGEKGLTPAREAALLAALERDRRRRGVKGVPDLD